MLTFFLCLSLAIFTAGAVIAVRMKTKDRIPWQSFLLLILIVTAISMWTAVLPLVKEGSILYKPLYAAFYMMESAIGNVDYSLFSDAIGTISFWRIYTIFLHLLMPATAYGVILAYFLKAFSWFRYTILRGNKKIILFSDLTGKSKAYAKRIKADDTLMIFCNTEEIEKQNFGEGSTRNMIFTDQTELQILKQLKRHDLAIMEMGDDEDKNVQKTIEIIRYLTGEGNVPDEEAKTIQICTVSGQPEAATIIDNLMKRGTNEEPLSFHHTLINEEKRIAFKLLHEAPLYKKIKKDTEQLDILIVGFGGMGKEILKAVSWAGCFPDIDTNVHVVSRHCIEDGRSLLSECPELGVDLRHKGGFLKPEKGEQLNPHAPIYYYSAETGDENFDKIIRGLSHCRYITVALDNDTNTLAAALRIYRIIRREQILNNQPADPPEIHIRIRDNENLHLFSSKDDRSILRHLSRFGSDEDIYSAGRVGQSVLDRLAKRARNIYRDEHRKTDEKSKYAYLPEAEKNANQTAAIHVLYKLHFFKNISFEEVGETLSDSEWGRIQEENQKIFDALVPEEERLKAAGWEHIRWQAYMRTEGYIGCPYEQIETIYNGYYTGDQAEAVRETRATLREARIHPCIGDGEIHLKKVSRLIGDPKDPYYFHKNDRRFVNSIPEIIGGAYRLIPAEKKQEGEERPPCA